MTMFLKNPSMQKKVTIFPTGTSCAAETDNNFKMAFKRWVIDANVNKENYLPTLLHQVAEAKKKEKGSAINVPYVEALVPKFLDTLITSGFEVKDKKVTDESWRPLLNYIFTLGKKENRNTYTTLDARYDVDYLNNLKQLIIGKTSILRTDVSLYSCLTEEQRNFTTQL